ncbi:MAG: outer membrane beta-barrel protein [Planctomycetaceae bacterium]|nr:outer membrane beta-barrel protein [Planctomycetaceae bacterium]
MQNSRRIRFSSLLGAGASMVLGTAGMLVSGALFAAEACTPGASCTPSSPNCQQCDQVFADAAAQLKNLNPGGCAPAACAAPSACADVCNPDAVFNAGCNGGCGGGQRELGDPWPLQGALAHPCKPANGWQVGGWTQFGYSNNPDGAFTGNAIFLDDRYEWDRLNLNQQYFYLRKVADGSNGLDFGGSADLMYGVDGNEGQSFGNDPGEFDFLNGFDHGAYEWAIPQLYGEVAYGKVSAKVGHFYTPTGYEVIPPAGNFFYSHQLTWYNSEPFYHTGVLTNYQVNDNLSLQNGWVLGWDTGFDQNDGGNCYLGGFTYKFNECTTFIEGVTWGDLGWRGNGFMSSSILTHKWTDRISSVHQFDVLGTDLEIAVPLGPFGFLQQDVPSDFAVNGITRDSVSVLNYVFYDVTDRVKTGIRQEWYKADSISYYTLTYGLNVKPMANLVIRPEVRHMWSPGNDIVYVNSQGGGEDLFNQTVFGIDAVLTY